MKANMFGIFSMAVSLVVASAAQAVIRPAYEKVLAQKQQAVEAKLAKMTYTPGNYVVRAIEIRNIGTRTAPIFKLLTDISPKILTLDKAVVTTKAMNAIVASVKLAQASAAKKAKNESLEGMLYIQIDASGVVKSLVALKDANMGKSDSDKFKFYQEMKARRASSVSKPFNVSAEFSPSILATEKQLNDLYNDVDPLDHDYMDLMDNCFNRSHYWARSNEIGVSGQNTVNGQQGGALTGRNSVKTNSIHSEKVFVFFTSRYQREFDHKWWYHTAPTVQVKSGSKTERFVLDRSYTDEPLTVEEWVYTFAGHATPRGRIRCKQLSVETGLQEYYDKNDEEYCFWFEGANMYTYTPNDLMAPNSDTQWTCDSLWSVTQGVPYPQVPFGPRKAGSDLGSKEYNDYVVSRENQAGWLKANKGNFIPDFCAAR